MSKHTGEANESVLTMPQFYSCLSCGTVTIAHDSSKFNPTF